MQRILLRKSDALAIYEGNMADLARALDRTRAAVSLWGRYVPELAARQLLDLHPKLKDKVVLAKPKRARTPKKTATAGG